jgi:hypothetical protein
MQKQKRLWLAGAFLLLAVPALAQRTTATIRGSVTDSTHAVIAGAKVTATNDATGLVRSTTSNTAGFYTFSELPVGTYRIDVEWSGFKPKSVKGVVVNVADDRAVDIQLEPGDVSETISVETAAVQVKTIGGDVSGIVTGEQVRELPLNGRNFLQLATLMPGVVAADFLNVKDKGLLGGSDVSVSGSDVTANLWTVDGANNNDVGSNRTILVYPSLDAIDEFKILRNSYGAEFGQSAGAQVNIVTRSGTNEFHGSAYYFGRRDALNSINYFLEQNNKPKEQLDRNDFGWSVGGPIIKDKLHFFASQEWNRETRGSVRANFVPTEAERNGDFSGPLIPGCSSPRPVDPLTGQPFPGNKIPADRISPGGLLYLQLYPLPNTNPTSGSCNNWVDSLNSPINWRQEHVRLDYTFSPTSRLMVRYTQDHWENNAPNLYTNLWGDDPFPAVDSNWSQPGRSLVVQLTKNIGATAVNTVQFSYSANSITVTRGGTDPGLNDQINQAIPTVFPNTIREYGADRGHPVFWGAQGYGQALWNEAPFHNNQDLFVLKDDYSAVFGKHFFKAGVLGSSNKKNEDVLGYGSSENSEFWGAAGLNGWGADTGNIMADFLLKGMTFGFDENSAQRQVPQRWKDLEFYVTDSWKVHPRVTIDYGVRYSKFFNPYANDNKIMSFDPNAFNAALGNDPCNGLLQVPGESWCQQAGLKGGTPGPNRSLFPENNDLFAPRLGIAWDVHGDGKLAVRAGAGEFFLRERLSPGLNIGNNPPFVQNINGIRALDSATEPCAGCFSSTLGSPSSGRQQIGANPYNWQWNLTVEKEIARNTTAQVSYVGNRGNHMLTIYDINQVVPGDRNHNGVDDRLDYARSSPADGSLRPYGVFGDKKIGYWTHDGHSIYHGLQTQLLSHFGRSQVQAAYTWSKVIANYAMDNSDGSLTGGDSFLDATNFDADRGLSRTHRAHVFNASLVLGLPRMENKEGFVKQVFGDWEFGTVAVAASGAPLTVLTGPIPGLNGGPSGTGFTDNQRPNRVPGQPCRADSSDPTQILNPAAYTLVGFQLGQIGTAGRGDCIGPALVQFDMSLYKNIKVNERVKLQLRFEVFNVFNRVNFMNYTGGGYSINTTMNPIAVTFDNPDIKQATKITSAQLPADFGKATATRDPRQAQFGIKLLF